MKTSWQFPTTQLSNIEKMLGYTLLYQSVVEVPHWQGKDVSNQPQGRTLELMNVNFQCPIPESIEDLQREYDPQLPWAEDQFQERVSGKPLNPPPSAEEWLRGNPAAEHLIEDPADGVMKFSHSYPERFWPRQAGGRRPVKKFEDTMSAKVAEYYSNFGIRYRYGDLNDVVDLLAREPYTRQAYLPIFFPEDTGAHHGERIPCTLGYHFILRDKRLHVVYLIRSCDFLRHFKDDAYMAARLCQWVLAALLRLTGKDGWSNQRPGTLTMHITSLHAFEADLPRLRREYGQ